MRLHWNGMLKDQLEKVKIEDIPKSSDGILSVDVYIHMPSQNRFIRFLCQGDVLDVRRIDQLGRHVDPSAYIPSQKPQIAPKPEIKLPDSLGADAQKNLNEIFTKVFKADVPPEESYKLVEKAAEDILNVVAPETKDLKAHLMKNLKYVDLMNDVSAITSIATFVAFSSGFDSKKSYRDLAYACLVMDSSMSEFSAEEVQQYYKDSSQMNPEVLARFKKHPARSHELGSEKLKSLSDVTMQLILNHHELFNGKGFPRAVRSESLFALVKVLAFAVDIFEVSKKSQLNGKTISIQDAVIELREPSVEPHLKRHSKKLVDTVLQALGVDIKTLEKKDQKPI
jgi:hypothetical protein